MKKHPSPKGRLKKVLYLIILLLALVWTTTTAPKDAIAEPRPLTFEEEVEAYIKFKFPENPNIMAAICFAESRYKLDAHGDRNNRNAPRGSWGICQINVAVHSGKIGVKSMVLLKDNIDVAREIWEERQRLTGNGYEAWGMYTNKFYKQYLDPNERTIQKIH